jgi:hypothetical protein
LIDLLVNALNHAQSRPRAVLLDHVASQASIAVSLATTLSGKG